MQNPAQVARVEAELLPFGHKGQVGGRRGSPTAMPGKAAAKAECADRERPAQEIPARRPSGRVTVKSHHISTSNVNHPNPDSPRVQSASVATGGQTFSPQE